MLDHARTVYRVHTDYGESLTADVPADRFDEVPAAGMNPPVWILGHVAIVGNFGLSLVGAEQVDLPGWRENFGRGSRPLKYAEAFTPPGKEELRHAVRQTHDRFLAATADVPAEMLERPNPMDALAERFPKLGDLLTHILTAHDAVHWGQLSAWRRAAGFGAV